MVRDLGQRLEKQVELKITGETTELDKTVLEKIGDPLVHLVRNCIDHGIEAATARAAAGKSIVGTIHMNASPPWREHLYRGLRRWCRPRL